MSSPEPAELEVPAAQPDTGEFRSILFASGAERPQAVDAALAEQALADLRLDQLFEKLVAGLEHFDLEPLYRERCNDAEAVRYRHEIVAELEREEVAAPVRAFTDVMGTVRERLELGRRLHNARQRQYWLLAAGERYCEAVRSLERALAEATLRARGMRGLRQHLAAYVRSTAFTALEEETRALLAELAQVRYTVLVRGLRVTVSRFQEEADLTAEVEQTFAKFREAEASTRLARFSSYPELGHVEASILELVAKLHPEPFARLTDYCRRNARFIEQTIGRFDREVHFYLAYLDLIAPLREVGLGFCLPALAAEHGSVEAREAFDLTLALQLHREEGRRVVCNDLELNGAEQLLVITGPNQGGKTTFARAFGQLHHLAALGLPVPAASARLPLVDQLLTHFEREEQLATLRSKFEDDLVRMRQIIERAGPRSVVILNESFASTTVRDALEIGREVLERLIARGATGVLVTFIDELSRLGDATVSMMSLVDAEDPAVRTHRVVRKPADGRAYAVTLAERHGLSYERLRRRLEEAR